MKKLAYILVLIGLVSSGLFAQRTVPNAPTKLGATAASYRSIDLTWTDNATNEIGFEIERSTNGTTFTKLVEVGQNVTTYTNTSLSENTKYYYRVRAINTVGNSGYTNVADATTPLRWPPPTDLKAEAVSATQITLSWTDNATSESSFDIERSTNGTTFTKIGSAASNGKSYQSTGLSADTKYYYRVRAVFNDPDGTTYYSAYSNVATATTQSGTPAAPTNLNATAASTSQINLSWTDNASTETDFEIERSTDGNNFARIATVTANVTTFQNTGLTENTRYYYRVRAYNKAASSYSDYSNTANATTLSNSVNAPTELTLTPLLANNMNNVLLKWKDNASDETGFEIESSTNGTSFTKAATVAANTTQYEIYLTPSARTYFRVRAIKGGIVSGYTNVVDYELGPESPLDLKATAVSSSQIDLVWSDRSTDETGYEVERSGDGLSFSRIAVLGANVVIYSSTGLTASTTYYYRVRGLKGSAGSAYTHIVNAKTLNAPTPTPPAAPIINASLSQNWTKNSDRVTEITAAWQDKSDNETGFEIQWGDTDQYAGGSSTVGANVTQYKIEGSWPGCGQKVYVRVRARNASGESAWSSTTVTTGIAVPETPNNVVATARSTTEIDLKWGGANESYSRESRFAIQYSTSNSFTSPTEVQSDQNTDNKTISGLSANTTYYFRIKTQNCAGESAWSATVSAKTLETPVQALAAPTNLIATAASTSQINLSWTDNASTETDFEIERSTDGNNFARIATVTANVTTFQNTGLTENTRYYYRVRAYNKAASSYSDYSNTANATTLSNSVNAPTELTLTPLLANNMNNVLLKWKDNASDETGFEIESSTNGTSFTKAATVAANTTQYEIYLTPSARTYFRVRAIKGGIVSGYTNVVDYELGPESPLDLKATAVSSSQIDLVWSDRSTDETGYEVERSGDGLSFSRIAVLGANVVIYSSTGLTASTTYYYRVRGLKGSAGSAYTHIVNAKTFENPGTILPSPPTNLVATAISSSQINLTWTDASTNETGFDIERSSDGKSFTKITEVGANVTTYQNTNLTANTRYYYRIRAINQSGASPYSNIADATTLTDLGAPGDLVGTAVGNSAVLSWKDNASVETGFELERSVNGGDFAKISSLSANTTTYKDERLRAQSRYAYRIRAMNGTNTSPYSNTATVLVIITDLSSSVAEGKLYPNPAQKVVTVEMNSSERWLLTVQNAVGQSILQFQQERNSRVMDVSVEGLPTGVYYLKVLDSERYKVFRFVKQ
ncbi:fibronectin type III domain-containing protein [uncultured Spirosoma sp.]|uniref:fibronectin type III domain-containing protein n=3 Tax=Spirosoma TaxID=107 RepID=UPI00262162E4|nr:fibronectin type III domain-containing protein [uncultured Spirosoma sp.]